MAMAGPITWRAVTTDHIGVPRGGLFGDVDRWEPVLNRHGLFLAWSLIWQTFGVYSKLPGGECVFQMHLKHKDGGPLPIDQQLVDTLVLLREVNSREDRTLREQCFAFKKKIEKEKRMAAAAEERSDRAHRATDKALMSLGVKAPKIVLDLGQRRNP